MGIRYSLFFISDYFVAEIIPTNMAKLIPKTRKVIKQSNILATKY